MLRIRRHWRVSTITGRSEPSVLLHEDQVHLLESLTARLRAHEVDEEACCQAGQELPEPDLPAYSLQGNPSGEDL